MEYLLALAREYNALVPRLRSFKCLQERLCQRRKRYSLMLTYERKLSLLGCLEQLEYA